YSTRSYLLPYAISLYQLESLAGEDSGLTVMNKDGHEWGFLGKISSYLIRTQSSELVLLIGMLGFGLLGASILSFQKGNPDENFIQSFSTTPLIRNFGSVLACGFGAALIVYLATKGGLAIFAMGGSQS